jgi:hypothetical protein
MEKKTKKTVEKKTKTKTKIMKGGWGEINFETKIKTKTKRNIIKGGWGEPIKIK